VAAGEHTLTFIGLRDFQGRVDTLVYVSSNTDTQAEIRDALVQTVKLGPMPFIAGTSLAQRLRITYEAPADEQAIAPAEDPWNLWVFTTRVNGMLDGESEYRYLSGNGSIEATRTAEDLKLILRQSGTAEIGAGIQQPWGSIDVSLDALQYLHDLSQHRIDLFGGLSIRVFRGLNFNIFGSVARVKDQLYLSGAGLTPEARTISAV